MRLSTIGARIAYHLRADALVTAGLKYVRYPAPAQVTAGPMAVIFASGGDETGTMSGEQQIWHHEIRVQLMMPAVGMPAAELNALETLIEPIWDTFAPGTNASRLIVPGEAGFVQDCRPIRYEGSQVIEYPAGTQFAAITLIFRVKTHRAVGDE